MRKGISANAIRMQMHLSSPMYSKLDISNVVMYKPLKST